MIETPVDLVETDVLTEKHTDEPLHDIEMDKSTGVSSNEDIDPADKHKDEGEGETASSKIDRDFEDSQAVFVEPDLGTPAAEALAGTFYFALPYPIICKFRMEHSITSYDHFLMILTRML